MHPVWRIEELRAQIFEHVRRWDLVQLARTCKEFHHLATDHLWSTIDSVDAFVGCLPPDFASRKLEDQDLVRLDFYARKIEVLNLNGYGSPLRLPEAFCSFNNKKTKKNLEGLSRKQRKKEKQKEKEDKRQKSESSWQQQGEKQMELNQSWVDLWTHIGQLRPTDEFLPNLRSVRVDHVVELALLPLVGISGAQLKYIRIEHLHESQPESVVRKFLGRLSSVSNLEYLFVRGGDPHMVPTNLLRIAVLKQLRLDPRLRDRNPDSESHHLRAEILQQSELRNLTLGLTKNWYSPDVKAIQHKYLPKLKTLWLNLRKHGEEDPYSEPDYEPMPAAKFFEGLDNPEMVLINIKFNHSCPGVEVLDVVRTISANCRLQKLAELVLSSGGHVPHCSECGHLPEPRVAPQHIKAAMRSLLPLPRLKVLRLSLVPGLLADQDSDFNKLMANGLPLLESLTIGSGVYWTGDLFTGDHFYERLLLQHVAAFCCLFPHLCDVQIGCVDITALEERPNAAWMCLQVTKLRVDRWLNYDRRLERVKIPIDRFTRTLETYFPNYDITKTGISSSYMFQDN